MYVMEHGPWRQSMLAQIYTVIIVRAESRVDSVLPLECAQITSIDLLFDKEALGNTLSQRRGAKLRFTTWGHVSNDGARKEWGMLQMQYIGLLNSDKHRKGPVQMFIQGRGSQERYVLDRLPRWIEAWVQRYAGDVARCVRCLGSQSESAQ
jgi:hypothetical protein